MKLNLKTDYALRVLIFLGNKPEEMFDIETLCRSYNLPQSSMMKIVSGLVAAGFVQSTRGRFGGIAIGKDPSEIRVGEVVRAMGEGMQMVDCSTCLLVGHCKLSGVLCEAAEAFQAVLMKYRLSDLLAEAGPVLAPLQTGGRGKS